MTFEFLRTSVLYAHKQSLQIKGHIYKVGDFVIRIGSLQVGTVATGQPYNKMFFVQL
jgi:hypothetical protein